MVCDMAYDASPDALCSVLILILLEYGLRLNEKWVMVDNPEGLNPYSIGIWSATQLNFSFKTFRCSLNPYSIGIWSATFIWSKNRSCCGSLNPYSIGIWSATQRLQR